MTDTTRPDMPTNGRPFPGTRVYFKRTGVGAVVEYYEWWWNSSTFPVKIDYSAQSQMVTALSVTWESSVVPLAAPVERAPAARTNTAEAPQRRTRRGVA